MPKNLGGILRNKRCIDLYLSRSAHAFRGEGLLWEPELRRILHLLDEHLRLVDHRERNHSPLHGRPLRLLSISLHGSYGSGKSSLLRTLVSFFDRRDDPGHRTIQLTGNHQNMAFYTSKVFSLPVLQPAVEGPFSRFLYSFLASVLEEDIRVQGRLEKNGIQRNQILSDLQRKFQEVSMYLQAIDKESTMREGDPLGVSIARLEHHSSNLRLQEELYQFISTMARSLCGDEQGVVLLPVDDADMSRDALVSTLDMYRHYLQHPQLVPVFSFTGRLAEELLCSHFEEDLKQRGNKITEASTELSIAENLAIQHLGKLFPIRNRIRLGAASTRVQAASFVPHQEAEGNQQTVHELLVLASRLLFGVSDQPLMPKIRTALRSSSLRRQLQLIDLLQAGGIGEWSKDRKDKGKCVPSWGEIFDRTTWSLLNVHRDVLKEYELNIDDLYSWTPTGLQQVVLQAILKKPMAMRRELINGWRHHAEDRRIQMLSLLAANVFRPTMRGEMPTGDDLEAYLATLDESTQADEVAAMDDRGDDDHLRESFSLRKGCYWFLNVWQGFYLPQILARNRLGECEPGGCPGSGAPITTGGWTMMNGAINAMREAVKDRHSRNTGMQLLNPVPFSLWVDRLSDLAKADPQNRKIGFEALHCQVHFRLDIAHLEQREHELCGHLRYLRLLRHVFSTRIASGTQDKRVLNPAQILMFRRLGLPIQETQASVSVPLFGSELEKLTQAYRAFSQHDEWSILLPQIWCFFGIDKDVPWSSVSFWRGLGLIGSLLKADIDWRQSPASQSFDALLCDLQFDEEGEVSGPHDKLTRITVLEQRRRQRVIDILWKHLRASKILGRPSENGESVQLEQMIQKSGNLTAFGNWSFHNVRSLVRHLALAFEFWLDCFPEDLFRLNPMVEKEGGLTQTTLVRNDWKACFTRRIHGENLIGHFRRRIDKPDLHEYDQNWTALKPLGKWVSALSRYWAGGEESALRQGTSMIETNSVQAMFLAAPILSPFSDVNTLFDRRLNEIINDINTAEVRASSGNEACFLLTRCKAVVAFFSTDQSGAGTGSTGADTNIKAEAVRNMVVPRDDAVTNASAQGFTASTLYQNMLATLFDAACRQLQGKLKPGGSGDSEVPETDEKQAVNDESLEERCSTLLAFTAGLEKQMDQTIREVYSLLIQAKILEAVVRQCLDEKGSNSGDAPIVQHYQQIQTRLGCYLLLLDEFIDHHFTERPHQVDTEEPVTLPLRYLCRHLLDMPLQVKPLDGGGGHQEGDHV